MNLNGLDNEFHGVYANLPRAEKLTLEREILSVPLLAIGLIALVGTLFITGVVKFPYYQARAASSRISRIVLPAPRGQILDRHGNVLAVNHSAYDCYFITSSDAEIDIVKLSSLGHFLNLSDVQLEEILEKRRSAGAERSMESELWAAGQGDFGARSILVKRDLNQVDVTSLLERKFEFPGVFLEQSYRRSYPAGDATAQVLGYVGQINVNELSDWATLGYSGGDSVGKNGIERQYDYVLRGESGERLVAVDAHGRIIGDAEMVPAVVPENGAVIVRDDDVMVVHDGEIDEFEPGVYIKLGGGILSASKIPFGGQVDDDDTMTLFRNTGNDGTYNTDAGIFHVFRQSGEAAMVNDQVKMRPSMVLPSGGPNLTLTLDLAMQVEISNILGDIVGGVVVMDPRTGAVLAMVSEPGYDPNLFSPSGADQTGWQAIMDDPDFPMLNRPVQNAYVPGSTFKIATALAAAENGLSGSSWDCRGSIEVGNRTFRCWNRGGHGTVNFTEAIAQSCDVAFWEMAQQLGHDKIADMAYRIGLGNILGVDLPEEKAGLIPNEEWKLGRFDERWFTGDTMNMAIGQGFVQLTVLQAATMTSITANGGFAVTPHLNRLLTPSQGALDRVDIQAENIVLVERGLRSCVTEGTAKGCNLSWIDLAGKTGTADDPPREDPHSWFLSYGPFENPCLVIVVLCENGGHGDEKAVPLARRIWESPSVKAYLVEQGVKFE